MIDLRVREKTQQIALFQKQNKHLEEKLLEKELKAPTKAHIQRLIDENNRYIANIRQNYLEKMARQKHALQIKINQQQCEENNILQPRIIN